MLSKVLVSLVTGLLVAVLAIPASARSGPRGAPGNRAAPQELLEQARRANPARYDYALKNGAKIGYARDGSTFWLFWLPEPGRADAGSPRVIVTLHGHGSYAFDEFFLWHRYAAERGVGILALQWWGGRGEQFQDYLAPHEIYRAVDDVLRKQGIAKGRALLHGFSRGSANCYAVAAMDRHTGNDYFGLVVANAGKPGRDFPSNVEIERGRFGARPFEGTRWLLYCGANDPHPERDGCAGMEEAERWVTSFGGQIALFIKDATGGHGGFHRNPANVRRAMELFLNTAGAATSAPPRRAR